MITNVNPNAASALIPALLEDAPIRNKDQWLELIQGSLQEQAGGSAAQDQLAQFSEMMKNEQIRRGLITDQQKLQLEADNAAADREAAQNQPTA